MASICKGWEKRCTMFSFKKDALPESGSNDESGVTQKEDNEDEMSREDMRSCDGETSNENEMEEQFNSEDGQISRLYREVVDDIMAAKKLRESNVDAAIRNIKMEKRQDFWTFPGINFCKPENCCAYLRHVAICHTGLVKKLVWKFLLNKTPRHSSVKEEIIHSNHLKVVSLGGGPGNDLVGFCSALQEISNSIETFELIVVDVCKGWEPVFPKILRKAKGKDFGSFSQCLKKKIITGFMEADLSKDKVFKDETLSLALGQADILLMVKLASSLWDQKQKTVALLHNVVDAMKPEAKLIFIDSPYDAKFFHKIKCLDSIYHDYITYEPSFVSPKSSPSIKSCTADIAIIKKKVIPAKDSSDGDET